MSQDASKGVLDDKKGGNDSKEDEGERLLVRQEPHTLRLLRLIEDGGHNTTYAKQARHILSERVASRASPLVLWDLVGRLATLLPHKEWSTRQSTALAMQAVAPWIPHQDQIQFLTSNNNSSSSDNHASSSIHPLSSNQSSQQIDSSFLWLSLNDLVSIIPQNGDDDNDNNNSDDDKMSSNMERNGIQIVLEEGRLLLASCGTQYDSMASTEQEYRREQEALSTLDSSRTKELYSETENNTNGSFSFLEQRVQLQRQILARRLGLGSLTSVDNHASSLVNELITTEDVSSIGLTTSTNHCLSVREKSLKRLRKRRRVAESNHSQAGSSSMTNKLHHEEKDGDASFDASQGVVRVLLVLEMKAGNMSSSSSHAKPQSLLATDLIYRMFDPTWYIRHGALLGTLALLRAWNVHLSFPALQQQDEHVFFGKWPQDILARCLCVLALDRFGDFSGGKVVAPVRETAAQLISLLLTMAPLSVQIQCRTILIQLVQYKHDWEVRHGAMLAFQYVAALLNRNHKNGLDHDGWNQVIVRHATQGLSDKSDDVKSVSAQVLSCFFIPQTLSDPLQQEREESTLLQKNCHTRIIRECAHPLWMAISTVHPVSSCALDLLTLFAHVVSSDCNLVIESLPKDEISEANGMNHRMRQTMLQQLVKFLEFDSTSVRLSCLDALGHIIQPILLTTNNPSSSTVATAFIHNDHLVQNDIATSYCTLVVQLFATFFDASISNGDADEKRREEQLRIARDATWQKLVNIIPALMASSSSLIQKQLNTAVTTLLLRYINMVRPNVGGSGCDSKLSSSSTSSHTQHVSSSQEIIERTDPPSSNLPHSSFACDNRSIYLSSGSVSDSLFSSQCAAANALALLCNELDVTCAHTTPNHAGGTHLFVTAIQLFLHSPCSGICESACLLYSALLQTRACSPKNGAMQEQNKKEHPGLLKCHDMFMHLLAEKTECITIEAHTEWENIQNDVDFVRLCYEGLAASLHNIISLPDMENDPFTGYTHFWKEVLKTKGYTWEEVSAPATISSMRLSSSIAGGFVSSPRLPSKLTPLIRSLMTSLKNEVSEPRTLLTSRYIATLIDLLSYNVNETNPATNNKRVRDKVLDNVCKIACISIDMERCQRSETSPSRKCAKDVIVILITELDDDTTLEQLPPIWNRLAPLRGSNPASHGDDELATSLYLLDIVTESLKKRENPDRVLCHIVESILMSSVLVACVSPSVRMRHLASSIVSNICQVGHAQAIKTLLPLLLQNMTNIEDDACRLGACQLLKSIVDATGIAICPFVPNLLPVTMSMLIDPAHECARVAASLFSSLVRVAPLVCESDISVQGKQDNSNIADTVIHHLIHGKPLPPCTLPNRLVDALKKSGTTLRDYQLEGIAWMRFLHSVHLNGALCDDLGLGKTLMALTAVAMAHCDSLNDDTDKALTLVVCPSTLVAHWVNEINRFFPRNDNDNLSIFRVINYSGPAKARKGLWDRNMENGSIVITSYSILRSDIDLLAKTPWLYCILDEGHLLKNPRTATARASRRIRSRNKLILTGTPVQNRVNELWAVFDYLMPNYLGTESYFGKEFAKPISNSQLPGASGDEIHTGNEKLKGLHQQVLPFILRRDKQQVLKELPPKVISTIPCQLGPEQSRLYSAFCSSPEAKEALKILQKALVPGDSVINSGSDNHASYFDENSLGNQVLKSMLYLRLLCTHPVLVSSKNSMTKKIKNDVITSNPTDLVGNGEYARLDCSGKLSTLNELLRSAGIFHRELTAADNDDSAIYLLDPLPGASAVSNEFASSFTDKESGGNSDISGVECGLNNGLDSLQSSSKCLIFAQFTQSLDVVEQFLFEPHMPSLRYLRLDGRVPVSDRSRIVDQFNQDDSIKVLLLTTRIGGLGLNLTGADIVIFLEHDWNPHVDIQAMDRAHRIGQKKTVHVYRLVTSGTIEEKIMKLQGVKLAMSEAIVNSDNSTMYSMGTDRLLDLFSFNTTNGDSKTTQRSNNFSQVLDGLLDQEEEYATLTVNDFLRDISSSVDA